MSAPPAQGVRLSAVFESLERARRRIARIEGARPDRHKHGPTAKTIAGLQRLLDDDDARIAEIRRGLEAEIAQSAARNVAELADRLARAIEDRAQRRRSRLRVVAGGRR